MIITFEELADLRHRLTGKRIVLAGGTFDLFHVNHLNYLSKLNRFGDVVIVYVNGDARVQAAKGPSRPVVPETDRAHVIDSVKGIDYVFIVPGSYPRGGNDPVYAEMFARLQPDVFVTSNNEWSNFKEIMGGTKLVLLPRAEVGKHVSTSAIINHIRLV